MGGFSSQIIARLIKAKIFPTKPLQLRLASNCAKLRKSPSIAHKKLLLCWYKQILDLNAQGMHRLSRVEKFHYCHSPLSKPYVRLSTHTAWAPFSVHWSLLFRSRSWGWVKFSWIRFATYRVLTPVITGVRIRHANLSLSSLSFPPSITRYCFASTTESVDSVRKTGGVISIPWSGICFNSGINGLSMTRIVGD